jgi:DNA-binding SARP family transcriptional activator/tetratricopeptide (TPR) repeat protein
LASPTMRARVLGGLDLELDGQRIRADAFERPSGPRVLKLLLATPGHRIRREEAAELLWPDAAPARSGANLRKAIHYARRGLAASDPGAEAVLGTDGAALWLEPSRIASIDVDNLIAAIATIETADGDSVERVGKAADVLAQLGGLELLPEDPYEDWLAPIRERLRQRSLEALLAASALLRRVDRRRAFALVGQALVLEPADERAHRTAIELHLEAGELHAARRQLQACRRAVVEAYGVEPDAALGRLVDDTAARRRAESVDGVPEAPIVGRQLELDAAGPAFDAVARGASTGFGLRGPAGIGKSRILRELAALARAQGWPIVEVRGLEEAHGGTLSPVAQGILAAAGGLTAAAFGEPARSALLTAAPSGTDAPALTFASDASLRSALLGALAELGEADSPLALIVDDGQWLDPSSFELVASVVDGGAPKPTLVLVAVRDEPALLGGAVGGLLDALERSGARIVSLGPLSPADVRTLLERDVAGGPLDEPLLAAIAELSAGTPLYAVELFRSARESGLAEQRDGRWQFRRGVDALDVPDGIARLIDRRISRLGPIARIVLATAAELGDVVAFEELVATGSPPDDVLDGVDAAIAAGIVVETDGRYAFGHPLYREALRRSLPPRDRASVHRRIAGALASGIDPADGDAVRRAGARGVDLLAIAGHAASAVELGSREVTPLAIGFGMGAGERQAFLFDYGGAVVTLRRALRIWQRLPDAARTGFAVSRAYVELGQALRRTGDDTGAEAALRAAIDEARDDDELATAASAASWLPYEHGRFQAALAILDGVDARLTDGVARARVDSARGWILGRTGDWSLATGILERAVGTFERRGPTADLMRALDRLAIAYRDGGRLLESIPILERAIHMAVELGRSGERAAFEMHLAGALGNAGRLDEAVASLERARVLARQTGEQYIESVIEWVSAELEDLRGNPAQAIEHRRRELAILGEIGGNVQHEAMAHAHLAQLAARLGDDEQARTEAAFARSAARHSGIEGLDQRVEAALAPTP